MKLKMTNHETTKHKFFTPFYVHVAGHFVMDYSMINLK